MFRSQYSVFLKEVKRKEVRSFQELKAFIENSSHGILVADVKEPIYWEDTIDCGDKCIGVYGDPNEPPVITVKDGVWMFKSKKPTTTFSKVAFADLSVDFENSGGIIAGSGMTCHLSFAGNTEISFKTAMISDWEYWQQLMLTAYGTFKDVGGILLHLSGSLILHDAGCSILDSSGNTLTWGDVISGIVKDANGIPRNVVSNVVL